MAVTGHAYRSQNNPTVQGLPWKFTVTVFKNYPSCVHMKVQHSVHRSLQLDYPEPAESSPTSVSTSPLEIQKFCDRMEEFVLKFFE
jgi:hypothetical protein